MEIGKSDNGGKYSENKRKEPNYINYLIGSAILLFVIMIGYNAFVVPDMDTSVQTTVDDADFKENINSDYGKIDINSAKKEKLMEIDGIGEQTAEKIINYRETHGGFSSKEELMEVSGIGEKIFEKLKDKITI